MACCCDCSLEDEAYNNSRILIRVKRIYNGAKIRTTLINESVTLSDLTDGYVTPLTYERAEGSGSATIVSQTVTSLTDGRSRIRITYDCPITVTMTDSDSSTITGSGTVTKTLDIIMTLPVNKSYTFELAFGLSSRVGSVTDLVATFAGCLLVVLKVLVECEVIVESGGCVTYPDATRTEFLDCEGVFNLDI